MKKIIEFIKTHPERVILGVAILFLLIILFRLINQPEDETITNVRDRLDRLKEVLRTSQVSKMVIPGSVKEVKAIWENLDESHLAADSNWIMYRRPVSEVKFREHVRIILKEIYSPVLKSVQIDPQQPDKATITWQKPVTPTATTGKDKSKIAPIAGYRLYRKKDGGGKASIIVELAEGTITPTEGSFVYEDPASLEPETEYTYYIIAFTDEAAKNMVKGRQESQPSKEVKVITPEIVDLEPMHITGDMLLVRVRKYINGKWDEKRLNVTKGELMGEKISGKDFRTNYIFSDFQEFTVKEDVGPGKLIKTGWKVFFKHKLTGKIINRIIEPEAR